MHGFDQDGAVEQCVRELLPGEIIDQVKRVTDGVSTIVYRVRYHSQGKGRTYYLRIAPEPDADLAAEAAVQRTLAGWGLHVPGVVAYVRRHGVLQRSVLLTTEIVGRPIGYKQPPPYTAAVLQQAGAELARLNQLGVRGFGWANRVDAVRGAVVAEHPTLAAWLAADYAEPLQAAAAGGVLLPGSAGRLAALLRNVEGALAGEPPVLAHGDFDPTHIYHQDGVYTGMIDFGEQRGAPRLYDVAHFALESGPWLGDLLAGYTAVSPITGGDLALIARLSVLIAGRRVGRRVMQGRPVHAPDVMCVNQWLAQEGGGA